MWCKGPEPRLISLFFDSIFATRSQLTVISLSGDKKYVSRLSEDPLKIMLCTLAESLYLTFFNGMLYFLVNTDLYIQFKLMLHNYNKDWKIINLVPNIKY